MTPNSHDSYNLADMGPDGRLAYMRWHVDSVKMAIYVSAGNGSHEHGSAPHDSRGGIRTGRRRVGGSRSPARSSGIVPRPRSTPCDRTAWDSKRSRILRSRIRTPARRTRRTVGASSSNRTGATTTSAAATCSWCRHRGKPRSGCTCRSTRTSHGGGRRRSCPRRGSPARQLPVASGPPCAFIREVAVFGDCSLRQRS